MLFPASRRLALSPKWTRDILWRRARAVPSLDLRFAESKSLVDATTGQNLVTFTRASSGTYVDSQGVLQRATTNLLLRSEEFDNASWSKLRLQAFGSGSVVDAAASPIGTLTAEKITEDSTTGFHYVQPLNGSTVASGATITTSIYAKASERIGIAVFPYSSAAGARFNLSLGTVHSVDAGVTASIQNVGNGWYRCIASITAPGTSATPWFLILNAAFGTAYAGDGTSGILVWGAQLEQSSTVGEYIPTTSTINSAPRFDHSPTTGESLGLLVEEQRTNTILQSNQFNTTWTLDTGNPIVSLVTHTAPDGSNQSWKLTEGTSNGGQDVFQAGVSNSSGLSVYSVYAKAAERYKISLRESTSTGATCLFDLSAGTVVITAGGGTPSPVGIITPVRNGWYRCSVVLSQSTTANRTFRIFVVEDSETTANGSVASRTGDGTSGIYIWGAQLEVGAFPTSYIPTTTATVTRSADVASITGSNFSSWVNTSSGSFLSEVIPFSISNSRIIQMGDGTGNNRHDLAFSSGSVLAFVNNGGATQVNALTTNTASANVLSKVGYAYSLDDFAWTLNAGSIRTDTAGSLPVVNQLGIGQRLDSTGFLNGTLRRLCFWPQRLSNETLQRITQ